MVARGLKNPNYAGNYKIPQEKSYSLKPDDKVVSHLLWYWHRGAEVCLWVLG